jgi:hypothetical protein
MRTTLSLDDDVAAQLEAWRAKEKLGLKEAVNRALRQGLAEVANPPARTRFVMQTFDLGGCNYADINEALEAADDEYFGKKLAYKD